MNKTNIKKIFQKLKKKNNPAYLASNNEQMGVMKQYVKPMVKLLFAISEVFFHFVFRLVYSGKGEKAPPIKDLLLLDSASTIAHKIRSKKVKCVDVLESFIVRIKEINPVLNCVVADRFSEAIEEAKNIDQLIQNGTLTEDVMAKEKPFLGVPFTTKDCIAVQGMIHTSGLVSRKNTIASEDADAVALLKKAGAIPIALTNVSELCMWWESYNNVHGRTNNAYDTNRIVGGSSGGEGCNQSAAGSAFGLGSDIGGSIRMPAFFNGVFGHKPTKFIVSNKGQFPIPFTVEQNSFLGLGPLTRRAEDLLPLLKVLSGKNGLKLDLDKEVDVSKLRIFYQEHDQGSFAVSGVNSEIKDLFGKIVLHFEKAHLVKPKKLELSRFSKSGPMWFAGMKAKSGPDFQDQLSNLGKRINLTWEWCKWLLRCSQHTFIALMTAFVEKAGVTYGDSKHTYLLQEVNALRQELGDLMGADGVFIYPTHPTVAPYHNEPLVKPLNFSYTAIINILGFPATHCPMGLNSEGIPLGVQVVANENNDRLCIAVARELEKAFGGWVPPSIEV